jgi:DNA polymerase-3 subunit epsilon
MLLPTPPLNTPLDALPIAIVDVETTGLDARTGDRVCEIAVLRVVPGAEPLQLEALVNPGRPIGAGASRVNGITDADVAHAPRFGELVPALDALLADCALVAHNAPFDLSFLATEYARAGSTPPVVPVVCTLALARRHFRFPSNSLGALAREFRITTNRAHRAGGDVATTLGVYQAIVRHLSTQGVRTLGELLTAHGPGWQGGPSGDAAPPLPQALANALAAGSRVRIRYSDQRLAITERDIRPLEVRHGRLVAWCYLRDDERVFSLDRIVDVWVVEATSPPDSATPGPDVATRSVGR